MEFLPIWNFYPVLVISVFWVNFNRISYYNQISWFWPTFLSYLEKFQGGIFDSEKIKFSNFLKTSEMMSLGQENVSEWTHSPSDSINHPKTWFFHAKPMKNIVFSWFSLSELTQRSRHAYRGFNSSFQQELVHLFEHKTN